MRDSTYEATTPILAPRDGMLIIANNKGRVREREEQRAKASSKSVEQKRRARSRTSVYLYNDVVMPSFLIDERLLHSPTHSKLLRNSIHFMEEDDLDLMNHYIISQKEKKNQKYYFENNINFH